MTAPFRYIKSPASVSNFVKYVDDELNKIEKVINAVAQAGGIAAYDRGAAFVGSPAVATPTNDVSVRVPIAGTISRVTILTQGGPGNCVIDIWKGPFGTFPHDASASITAAAKPEIASDFSYEDTVLSGWDVAVEAGDVLTFHLESALSLSYIAIQLEIIPS